MSRPLTRAEVDPEQTWNLDDLFSSEAAWLREVESIAAAIETVARHQGRLHDVKSLLVCLDAQDALWARLQPAYLYAYLRNASDGTDPAAQAALARVASLEAQVNAGCSFVNSEILLLPDGTIEAFLRDEPLLAVHRTSLEDALAVKPHMLAAETEKVLSSLGEVLSAPFSTYSRSKSSDLRFAPFTGRDGAAHPNSFNLYEFTYESHPDVAVRRAAWKSFCEGLVAYKNTYAATLATEITKNVVLARARRYPDAEHFLLQDHKVSFEMYRNILDIVRSEVAPHMRRYAQLRRRVLGLDHLLFCDIKAPLDPDYNPPLTFEEAGALIREAVQPMGEAYGELIHNALTRRWVDRVDNVGKSSGAFCAPPYGHHPFILVTWANSMRDAFVLAHELGHAGHFAFAGQHQRFVNREPAMPFIEAPSIMNEMLLARHILARSQDQRMRRWIIMQVLGTYHHNFVTHLLEGLLQRQLYARAEAGEAVTASLLCTLKKGILEDFWGDAVRIDDDASLTWMRQPHYYFGLYSYTYSVGLIAATALAERARNEGPQVFADWLEVLKAGGTQKPLDLFKRVGLDLSTPDPIRSAVRYVGELVDELERSF